MPAETLKLTWQGDTLQAFLTTFASLGFEPCLDGEFEPGWGKIAVYTDSQKMFTHVAIQLPEARIWSSKMGRWEDISRTTIDAIEGHTCGSANQFLRRPLPQ